MGIRFKSIKVKLLLALLAFGLIPFGVASVLSVQTIKSGIQREIESKLLLYANAKVEGLLAYFDGIEGRTLDFASDGFIREQMQTILQVGTPEAIDALNTHLLRNKKPIDPTLVRILVMDTLGNIRASTHADDIGKNEAQQDYFQKGQNGSFIRETQQDEWRNEHSFLISAPLYTQETHEWIGVLLNVFDARKLQSLLGGDLGYDEKGNSLLPQPLHSLEVYMVDGSANMFVHPRHNDAASMSQHFTGMKVDTLPVQQCLTNHQPLFSALYRNYRGEEVIGTSVCFPERQWVILSEVSVGGSLCPPVSDLPQVWFRVQPLFPGHSFGRPRALPPGHGASSGSHGGDRARPRREPGCARYIGHPG